MKNGEFDRYFDEKINELLGEMVETDVIPQPQATDLVGNHDSYAPGDTRIPNVLTKSRKKSGKNKKRNVITRFS